MKILYIFLILIFGCSEFPSEPIQSEPVESEIDIDIYTNLPLDENGYYHKVYPKGSSSTYERVYVKTLATQRVFWSSPNSFDTHYQQQLFTTPIIQYSTYTSSDGIGQQFFYLYEQFIGDTLTIIGSLSSENWDYTQIIIE